MRSSSKRLTAAAILAAGLPLALLAAPSSASASVAPQPRSCVKTGCNGLDPTLTYRSGSNPRAYCNAGSRTIVNSERRVFGGTLELRWGPNCQTNWVRFTPSNNDAYGIGLYGSSLPKHFVGNGIDHAYVFSGKGITRYSDQVYSPGPAKYCVADETHKSAFFCVTQKAD
jgi:hypothetical protein